MTWLSFFDNLVNCLVVLSEGGINQRLASDFCWFSRLVSQSRLASVPFRFGGEGGIRTHGELAPTPDFESGTFDHSATSPQAAYFTSLFSWQVMELPGFGG